jgi:tRNA threonylcarbamoyladenosine biosynthesis protein TsaE
MENRIEVNGLVEMEVAAKELLKFFTASLNNEVATIVAISGDLGAGKTTFVQHLAKELGIFETVTSPTFTIMKIYQAGDNKSFNQLVHMDAYRVDSLDELRPLKLAEIFKQNNTLICIEWAEKIKDFLPENTIYLNFETVSEDSRVITITGGESAV